MANQGNERFYLPPTLREIVGNRDSAFGEDDTFFMRIFPYNERIAMYNNLQANRLASGFLQDIHTNLLNAKVVSSIHKKLVKKITTNVKLGGESDSSVESLTNGIVNLRKGLAEATSYMLSRGESCITLESVGDGILEPIRVVLKAYPLARYNLTIDKLGIIQEAYLYKQLFDGSTNYIKYVLSEHRFKKGDKFYWEYVVTQFQFSKINEINEDLKSARLDKEDLPASIAKTLGDIEINKPHEIATLGVYHLKNTEVNMLCPFSNIGESQYIDVIDEAIANDAGFTAREIDKYLGRGRVLTAKLGRGMPQRIQISADGKSAKEIKYERSNQPFDYTFMQAYENSDPSKSVPQSIQFGLRTEEWTKDKLDYISSICTKCGLSVFDYDPTLCAGARTAREIDELSDITASTVNEKRNIINDSLKGMLDNIAEMLDINVDAFFQWDKSTTVNKAANNDMVLQRFEKGLISKKTALKELNPEWNDAEVDEELRRINEESDGQSADVLFNNL